MRKRKWIRLTLLAVPLSMLIAGCDPNGVGSGTGHLVPTPSILDFEGATPPVTDVITFTNFGSTSVTTGRASEGSAWFSIDTGCNTVVLARTSSCVIHVTKSGSGSDGGIQVPYTGGNNAFALVQS